MADATAVQSQWYRQKGGPVLEQGDILVQCPVFRPHPELTFPMNPEDENLLEMAEQDVIVISQSCDIKPSQKKDVKFALLCSVFSSSQAEELSSYFAGTEGKRALQNGNVLWASLLDCCPYDPWKGQHIIVSFRDVWSLPVQFLMKFAEATSPRTSLADLYREELSRRFGAYYVRVGLRQKATPLPTSKEKLDKLEKLYAVATPEDRRSLQERYDLEDLRESRGESKTTSYRGWGRRLQDAWNALRGRA